MSTSEYRDIVTSDQWLCADCATPKIQHHHAFRRQTYPFVAMLRIRNEAQWIREVITSTFQLCSQVFVLDDHSTDGTTELCESLGPRVTVFQSPFTGLDEARDKSWLYDQIIRQCAPEWILCIDGDEVLEGPAGEAIRKGIADNPEVNAWALKIEFLWNDPLTVRADRIYGDFWRPSLFRPCHEIPGVPDSRTLLKEFRFQSTPFGRVVNGDKPNLHCSSVPQRLIHGFKLIPARLKHYGYMKREWRVGKLDYYTSIDWLNQSEGMYAHMCQGDAPKIGELPKVRALVDRGILTDADVKFITDVPKEAHLLHAGPLELRAWREGVPWEMSAWAKGRND